MIAISLTHDGQVAFFEASGTEGSNGFDRYWVLRTFRSNPNYYGFDAKNFDSLTVPEMRLLTGAWITDRQLAWLNWYYRTEGKKSKYATSYFTYRSGYNYGDGQYYSEDNQQKWEDRYQMKGWNDNNAMLADYDLNYGLVNGQKERQPWIVFEEGGVCGSQAKLTQNLHAAAGYPGIVVSQPAHAAFTYWSVNSKGEGEWGTWNFISNWSETGINKTNQGHTVMLLGWGSDQPGWLASFTLLAQEALNHGYAKDYKHGELYYLSAEMRIIASAYTTGSDENLSLLEAAFDVLPYNWDVINSLEKTYRTRVGNNTATLDDYANKVVEIVETLKYYPYPMWLLAAHVALKYVTTSNSDQWTLIYDAAVNSLYSAKNANSSQVLQYTPANQVASWWLNGNSSGGVMTYQFPYTFAFDVDGDTATITPKSNWANATGQYSVDGGTTWHSFTGTTEIPAELTSQINVDDGFQVKYSDKRVWSTGITSSPGSLTNTTIYANDRENKFYGKLTDMEYSTDNGGTWVNFKDGESPIFEGDQTVLVRLKRTSTTVSAGEAYAATFTDTDEDCSEYCYITLDHLTFAGASSSRDDYPAKNFIDGNINTAWSTLFRNNDKNGRYYTVQLDQPRMINKVEYYAGNQINACGGSCYTYVTNLTVSVSMNGKNWKTIAEASGWNTNASDAQKVKTIECTPTLARYVRLQNKNQNGSNGFQGAILNLFEQVQPNADAEYSSVVVEQQGNSEQNAWIYTPTAYTAYNFTSYPLGKYTNLTGVKTAAGTVDGAKKGLVYGSFTGATLEANTDNSVSSALVAVANQVEGNSFRDLSEVITWLQSDSSAVAAFEQAAAERDWSEMSGGTTWSYDTAGDWSSARAYRPANTDKALEAGIHLVVDKTGRAAPKLIFTPYTDLNGCVSNDGKSGILERIYYPVDKDGNLLVEVGATASSGQSIWGRTQWGYGLPEESTRSLGIAVSSRQVVDSTDTYGWEDNLHAGVNLSISDNKGKSYQVTTGENGWATLNDVLDVVYDSGRSKITFKVNDSSDKSLVGYEFVYEYAACTSKTSGNSSTGCKVNGKSSDSFTNGWGNTRTGNDKRLILYRADYNGRTSYILLTSYLDTPINPSWGTPTAGDEGETKITASWDEVDGATGYSVQLYRDGSASGDPIEVSEGTAHDFTFSEEGTYTFTVTALGDGKPYTNSAASAQSAGFTLLDAPAATSVTISYTNETITYDDEQFELSASAEFGEIIESGSSVANYLGQTLYLRKKGNPGEGGAVAVATKVSIPTRAEAPTGVSSVATSSSEAEDGKLTGVNDTMEYRRVDNSSAPSTSNAAPISGDSTADTAGGTEWIRVAEDATEVTGLAAGLYEVRVAAVAGISFASTVVTVTVEATASSNPDQGGSDPGNDSGGSGSDGSVSGDSPTGGVGDGDGSDSGNDRGESGSDDSTSGDDTGDGTSDEGTSSDEISGGSEPLSKTGASVGISLLAVLLLLAGAVLVMTREGTLKLHHRK